MRIYMQKPSEEEQSPRFYQLLIQQDLLDGWTLVREWGNQGASGKVKKTHYDNRDEAELALLKMRDAQIGKGYSVVFLEGTYN